MLDLRPRRSRIINEEEYITNIIKKLNFLKIDRKKKGNKIAIRKKKRLIKTNDTIAGIISLFIMMIYSYEVSRL